MYKLVWYKYWIRSFVLLYLEYLGEKVVFVGVGVWVDFKKLGMCIGFKR